MAQLVEEFFPTEYDQNPTQKITCLSVEDRRSQTTALAGVLSPVFVISWTKDSQSIVTVEHIAGGTQAVVLHYQDDKWKRHEVEPLSEDRTGHYAVTGLKLGQNSFEVTYKVADNSVTNDVDYYLCKFRVEASTGTTVYTGRRREITGNTYIHTVFRSHR